MILAIGIDLQHVDFFEEVLKDKQRGFLDGHFTVEEASYCLQDAAAHAAERLAVRYAAKEALIKALGTTRYNNPPEIDPAKVDYKEIEVTHDDYGRPYLRLHGEVARILEERGMTRSFVSLSHDKDYAIAQVLLEG